MDRVKSNLDEIDQFIHQRENDWVHATIGGEGLGKSTLNAAMSFYIDDTFNADRMHFNGDTFRSHAMELEPGQAISHDEAVEDMYKREGMATNVRKMIKFLRKCRYLQLFITLSLPSLSELDRSLWDPTKTDQPRIRSIARVVKPGWVWFYSQQRFTEIDTNSSNGVDWPEPDFKDEFPNLQETRPEYWTKYMEKKQRDIADAETMDDDEVDLDDVITSVKAKQDRYRKEYKGREYLDWELISHDFDLSEPQSKKAKKVAEADLGIN